MIFKNIQIENLFAYNGIHKIDLSGCDGERNIIIISGRNGSGKTSLINAIKLLFLGATDPRIRRIGFPPTILSVGQFVRGVPGVWNGLFNVHAQQRPDSTASIAILWEEEGGNLVEARRRWKINGPGYDETLEVFRDGVSLLPDDMTMTLAQTLPRDFVPFFFFDGEQIRELAEAEDAITANEIERILNLSFVGEIEQGVAEFVRQRRRDALPEATRVRIRRAEGELATKEAEREAAERKRLDAEADIEECELEKRNLMAERDDLRSGVSEADQRLLEERRDALEEQRDDLARRVSEALPPEAPFLANLDFTLKAFEDVELFIASHQDGVDAQIDKLCTDLPRRLLDEEPHPPIPLELSQIEHLREKLIALLASYTDERSHDDTPTYLTSLNLSTAHALRDQYAIWAVDGASRRKSHGSDLQRLRTLAAELDKVDEDLARISVVSDSLVQRFQELSKALTDIDNSLASKYEDIGKINAELTQCDRAIKDIAAQIKKLEDEHEHAQTASEIVQYARRVGEVLRDYKGRQREIRRASVEKQINEKLAILLADHGQIRRVSLNDRFIMTYYDNSDRRVGRASISAGMKQLIATALLWALKDESEKAVPVVIDTPLARIDLRNRARLLDAYYPTLESR